MATDEATTETAPAADPAPETAPAADAPAGDAPKTEPAKTDPAKVEAKTSRGLLAVLNKDREAFKRKQEADAAMAKAQEIEKRWSPLEEAKARRDHAAILNALGMSLSDVVDMIAAEGKEPTPAEVAKKVVEETLAAQRKAEEERAAKDKGERHEQNVKVYVGQLDQLAKANPEKYELVNLEPGAVDEAWKLTELHYAKTGEWLSKDKALETIEQVLEQQEVERITKSKKLRARFAADPQAGNPKSNGKAVQPSLNHSNTSGVPVVGNDDEPPEGLSDRQRVRWAAKRAGIAL